MKFLAVLGTRPEAIKLSPVLKTLHAEPGVATHICITGQHRDLTRPILDLFSLHADFDLETMVPQQALFALNSAFVVEQAKALAQQLDSISADHPDARVENLYRAVLMREPNSSERAACREFVAAAPAQGTQLTTWQQVAQVLLCSNELMYLD